MDEPEDHPEPDHSGPHDVALDEPEDHPEPGHDGPNDVAMDEPEVDPLDAYFTVADRDEDVVEDVLDR